MISISVNLLFAAVFCSIENDGIVYELFRNILNTMCVTVFMNGFILLGRRRPGCLSSHLLSMLVGLQKLEIPKVCTKCHVRCHTLNSNNTISFGGVTGKRFVWGFFCGWDCSTSSKHVLDPWVWNIFSLNNFKGRLNLNFIFYFIFYIFSWGI